MRLLRLKLLNWRGVVDREIEFADAVTLVEGPNEVGKSTIVEAVQMLFEARDNSKTKKVQAVAPVGQDVGSSVELDFAVGQVQLSYRKTFNKNRSTELKVWGEINLQLAGREAHEWVDTFLASKVDMALWRALLVDQSDTLAKANLQSSQGLASALDEAAGTRNQDTQPSDPAAVSVEDTALYAAAAQEYERYFTLKTGKPKAQMVALQQQATEHQERLEQAQLALQTIAQDTADQERLAAEVLRLQRLIPQLQEQAATHEAAWSELDRLQEQEQAKRQELVAAQVVLQKLQQAQDARQLLAQELQEGERLFALERKRGEPLQQQVQGLKEQLTETREALVGLRERLQQQRQSLSLAAGDAQHYANLDRLSKSRSALATLEQLRTQMAQALQVTKATKVTSQVVAEFHAAETELAVIQGQRDTAATRYEVLAATDQTPTLAGQATNLSAGDKAQGAVSEVTTLDFPGVARITLTPSASVADLQDGLNAAEATLNRLRQQYQVADSAAAQQVRAQRDQAQGDLDKLEAEQDRLLGGNSLIELEQEAAAMATLVQSYQAQRAVEPKLPATAKEAEALLAGAKQEQATLEMLLEQQRDLEEQQRQQFDLVDDELRRLQRSHEGLAATLTEKKKRLAQEREQHPDADLQTELGRQGSVVTNLTTTLAELTQACAAANPQALEALRSNAELVLARAAQDLAQNQRRLDTLNDLLQRAQADGRFEAADNAKNQWEQSTRELEAMQVQAAAAQRLWASLSEHRDRSRQAYVEPLKRAIETLGAIVYGQGFSVELDDSWTLISRTLHGTTLPFDSLSIGAQEQLGILLRLAAGQVTAAQGGVPLIIDDALGFSDPARLTTMGAAIAAAGRQAQIIILTCTPGRFTQVGNAKVVSLP